MNLNESFPGGPPTKAAEQLLEDLAAALDIPISHYEDAERSYKSLGQWLDRPESSFANVKIIIYPQGSFRLGTVIRPLNDSEEYDLDVTCEVNFSKTQITQIGLKQLLGREIRAYAKSRRMGEPDEARRCWRLNYANEAQFHMDILPAVSDGDLQQKLLETFGHQNDWARYSVAITDTEHANYRIRHNDWPASNPKGYSEWFWSQMRTVFNSKRRAIALMEAKAKVEEIPEYRVKTPLQAAIQLLKRHRDIRFAENADNRPISIILTTLAAQAYNQETTISAALYSILARMEQSIDYLKGVPWIRNPTDPRENFADKWQEYPERQEAFFEWLEIARADFRGAAQLTNLDELVEALAPRMGRRIVETAAERRRPRGLLPRAIDRGLTIGPSLQRVFGAPHRQHPPWPELGGGMVEIVSATLKGRGKPIKIHRDGYPIPKGCDLLFEAKTNVLSPFTVFWQIVNTGPEATAKGQLRGGFDQETIEQRRLTRRESTKYTGTHSVECFIVKDGYYVARSGPFIVNIA